MKPNYQKRCKFLITCEHASSRIPESCREDLETYAAEQEPHRLYDWGAKEIARILSIDFPSETIMGNVCRLAIDLNRSIGNPEMFASPISVGSELRKGHLIERYFIPFRELAEKHIRTWLNKGFTVVHLSVHSFTPIYEGKQREVEIGILYDPDIPTEERLGRLWSQKIQENCPQKVLVNEPYKGTDDGHVTSLRRLFNTNYLGFEIELSQGLDLDKRPDHWADLLSTTLLSALAECESLLFDNSVVR